ncbi:MAG TPA: Xaa-Pro peptidase family protein [Fimbriimonas sp.]|nr:Xaa-Pro peptidase family protein [Fimbriimonas sp.]
MSRIAALAQALQDSGYDAYFAQTPISMGYLADFFEDAHERFMVLAVHANGDHRLICPALSRIQAERVGIQNIVSWKDGESPLELFSQLAEDWRLRTSVMLVDDHMPAKMVLEMEDLLPKALFKAGSSFLGQFMACKTEVELQLMHQSGAIVDDIYDLVKQNVKEGMTEIDLQNFIQQEMQKRDGICQFCSVCFGPGSAESHHINDDTRLTPNTLVLIDYGCTFKRYCSDITRVFSFGKASDEQKAVYDVVYNAHIAARDAVVPGAIPRDVDAAARAVIAEAGYDEFFTHRTGHGIGMQVHEDPYISSDNSTPLEVGNCFSIEPGIYLAGQFGVRLENLYTATSTGWVCFNRPISPVLEEV